MEAADSRRAKVVVGNKYCEDVERELTIRKTSIFYSGDGFEAYDHHNGDLVFRVDTYDRSSILTDELVLMDPDGASIITLRRKESIIWPSLHNRWEGFLGERAEGQKPLFSVRRSSIFGGDRADVSVEVNGDISSGEADSADSAEYRVEGSFAARSCRVLYEAGAEDELVAEIKRKGDACAHAVFGRDVFCLCLRPCVDAAFAMGLVLVLDRISGDEDVTTGADSAAVADHDVVEWGSVAGAVL